MTTNTATETLSTDQVLVGMLTENTGSHFLDSGGAYGRHWERNQGMTVESALAAPAASWGYNGEYVVLDVFHFLRERVDFDAELQAEFDAFTDQREDAGESWESVLSAWLEASPHRHVEGGYTYNFDNSLSQDVVYDILEDECGEYILILRIHNGCDARGGFTSPKFFRGSLSFLYDCNDFSVYCEGQEPPQRETLPGFPDTERQTHSWYFSGGAVYDQEGMSVDVVDFSMNDDDIVECPTCGAACQVEAPYPSD